LGYGIHTRSSHGFRVSYGFGLHFGTCRYSTALWGGGGIIWAAAVFSFWSLSFVLEGWLVASTLAHGHI
jgi:hypothetical protein